MAEAVLELVLHNLNSLIQKELGLFLGFDQHFNSLSSLLTTIKATLEDAEEKQFTDRAIKDWLLKLKDAAHVLDDILDDCATQLLEMESKGPSHKVQSSFRFSFNPKNVAFRYQMAKKMKNMLERLDEIAEERNKFHLTQIAREERSGVLDWRQTTSIITQPQVYGREEDKDRIINFLVGDASSFEDLSVYPIVGLGGLGKTTLAQLVFNHERVVNHFELRIWVCVSEDFSLKRMTKAIIESTTGDACAELDLEPLQRKLLDLLKGKKYLLVLDDVWDDGQENWQRLKSVLACGGKGASILVTTRLLNVAEIMKTVPPHDLSILSNTDCWELMKQRAFGPNEEERGELVVIGKEIVKKCGGVPLAAMALGGLLRLKREKIEWLNVKESKLWNLQGENSVRPALRLSYLNLPVKLRPCFALCALFPKDLRINKKILIELWMANGFISSNGMLEAEDIGNEVWNELYWRSFFQDINKDDIGEIENFKMHDLVHDLAQSIAQEVSCCITESSVSKRILHLSTYGAKQYTVVGPIQLHVIKSLRTFLTRQYDGLPPDHVLKCYSLRVLDFKRMKELPSSIFRLKHLRYLNLSWGKFKTLPESLCKLRNLQILKLDYCFRLHRLPYGLVQLKALQHLSLKDCHSLLSLSPHIRKLASLKTLTMYVVGKKKGFHLVELGQMNLKGSLCIKHLERVKSVKSAKEANMFRKQVNNLELEWRINEDSQLQENVEEILEVLEPETQQLQSLTVRGYTGAYFPQWISSSSLYILTTLQLLNCESCLHLPDLGKLPSLKNLKVSNMSHVKYLYEEESWNGGVAGGFRKLEKLELEQFPNLVRLSSEDRDNMFPCLSNLQITECPILLELPCLPSLSELRVCWNCSPHLLSSFHKHHTLEILCFNYNEELSFFPDGMLRDLTCLKNLDIRGLSKLEQLPDEVSGGLRSLKKLEITKCQKFNLSESFQYLTCLEKLIIESCPEIEGLHEALQHMCALQSLRLGDLPNLASLPDWLGNLGLLQDLMIYNCPKFNLSESFQYLTRLQELRIQSCPEIEALHEALQHMTSLQSLSLGDLPNLASLPDWLGNLALLQDLMIYNCPKFNLSESFQYLTCLEKLIIEGCSKIEGLHEALQHMSALQSLILGKLPNLASLPDWLGNLGLLHKLMIYNCPKLTCLPISIQRLTSLKRLEIYNCSELVKRCKENTGEDWHKIAHIPDIYIGV